MSQRIKRYKTKEEIIKNTNKGDKLFYDPFIDEYFIVSPKKYIWIEGEFEENFISLPETFEECLKLRADNCQDCEYLPLRGKTKFCLRKTLLINRGKMEIF